MGPALAGWMIWNWTRLQARIESLLLLGRPRLFGLLGRDETLTIPWADIERIGLDAILVRTDIPAAPPSRGGLLDKLRQWLNG